jgi:hypothetical protein
MSNIREVVKRAPLLEKGLVGGSPTRIEELLSHTSVQKYAKTCCANIYLNK